MRPDTTVATPTGERAAPFATLARALEMAPDGAWVLVGAGDLSESVRVTRAVHIVGLCAARTRLLAEGTEPVVNAVGGGAALDLRGVTLRGGVGGLWASEGATVEAERVVIERVVRVGVRADGTGTRVTLRDAVVRDTRTETDGTYGYGLLARVGATLTAQRVGVLGNTSAGALAATRSTLTLTDTAILGTRDPGNDGPSTGVQIQEGSTLTAERLAVVGNAGNGVIANDTNTRLTVTDGYVADTARTSTDRGIGVTTNNGARSELRRCSVVRNEHVGVRVSGAGATSTIEDLTVRETRGEGGPDSLVGVGLRVSGAGASATARRVRLEANASRGVLVDAATAELTIGVSAFNRDGGGTATMNGTLTLRQFLVEENTPVNLSVASARLVLDGVRVRATTAPASAARGVELQGGSLEGGHVVIEGSSELGVLATRDARVTLTESLVRDTHIAQGGPSASGFHAQEGATATLTRSVLEDNDILALSVRGVGTAHLEDCVIRRTRAVHERPPNDSGGRGVEAANGASVTLRRTLVTDNADIAANASGEGSTLTLDHSVITNTQARDDGLFGVGLYVGTGANAAANGSVIAQAQSAGVIVSSGSTLRFARGVVRDTRGADLNGALGQGLVAFNGARVELIDSLLTRNRETGVSCVRTGTTCTLTDVAITDTQPSHFLNVMQDGFGMGLVAQGASLTARRVAVLRSSGAAILSTLLLDEPAGSSLDLQDVFIATVAPQFIRYTAPYGDRVGYGAHVTPGSSFAASRLVVGDADFGFFQAGGTLSLSNVVLHGNTTLAGAVAPGISPDATRLDGVTSLRNSANEIRREVRATEASLPLSLPCAQAMNCEPNSISPRLM